MHNLLIREGIIGQVRDFMHDQPAGQSVIWRPAVFKWQDTLPLKILMTDHPLRRVETGTAGLRTNKGYCFLNKYLQEGIDLRGRVEPFSDV